MGLLHAVIVWNPGPPETWRAVEPSADVEKLMTVLDAAFEAETTESGRQEIHHRRHRLCFDWPQDHVRQLLLGERFGRYEIGSYRQHGLEATLKRKVLIGYLPGGVRSTVIIPDDDEAIERHHLPGFAVSGETELIVTLADYIRHGPDVLLARHLGVAT